MSDYYWIMTPAGLDKRAAAEAGGSPINLVGSHFAVGDGNGEYHEPEELLEGLINETWRGAVNNVYQHPEQSDLVIIEALIPADVGGWDIREAGIYDADDDLILVGKYPLTSKPVPDSGAAKVIIIRGGLRITNGIGAVLQIPDDMIMATKEYVDAHAALTNPHQATHLATPERLLLRDSAGRAKVAAPSATDDIARKAEVDALLNSPAFTGTPTAPTAAPGTNTTQLSTTAFVQVAVAALVDSSPDALNTLNELAAALGDDASYATTVTNALAGKSPTGHGHANDSNIGGPYAASGHNHSGTYEPANSNIQTHVAATAPHSGHALTGHGHTNDSNIGGPYSASGHNHSGTYEPANANIQTHVAATAPHSGHSLTSHGHANDSNIGGPYSASGHNHSGTYEPANSNIQTHVTATAPHSGHSLTSHNHDSAYVSFDSIYPVGSIYLNASNSANPGTLLGHGTWTQIAAGRMLLGVGDGYTAGATGGAAQSTLSVANMPAHNHTGTTASNGAHSHDVPISETYNGGIDTVCGSNYAAVANKPTSSAGAHTHTFTTADAGSGTALDTISPYLAVYIWMRTA